MRRRINPLIILLLALFPIIVPAADLPTLEKASNIREGYLDNGIKYYIASNKSSKGIVDMALVQKTGFIDETKKSRGAATVQARGSLTELQHFSRISPQTFLTSNGIRPAAEGYVEIRSDATIFRFSDIPVSDGTDAADSTMLLIFDITGRGFKADGMDYSPQNQAIIVSGDVDPDQLINKMNMLSMLVTRQNPGRTSRKPYVWIGTSDIKVEMVPARTSGLVSFTIRYRLPRTPDGNMATVQPLVAWKYASELEILLRRRLGKALRSSGIPTAGIEVEYRSSDAGDSDETFSISVSCRPAEARDAMKAVAAEMASIDREGINPEEYRGVTRELATRLRSSVRTSGSSNSSYVRMCIASYLYGASLADPKDRMDFFLSRNLDDATGARLFNGFVTALLDKSANMDVITSAESLDENSVWRIFRDAWEEPKALSPVKGYADTLLLRKSAPKVKIKTTDKDPISDGQLYTFSNGQRVVYKEIADDGLIHFSWRVKGGYSQIPGLRRGEGACITDVAALAKISGLGGDDFRDILMSNGIVMRLDIGLSELRISGESPAQKFPLAMKAMLSLTGDREQDAKAYAYYRDCAGLQALADRGTPYRRLSVLDSIMTPENNYSAFRNSSALSDDLPKKVERFLDAQFSKMNDGVLVIAGKIDEATLRKTLVRYMGGFRSDRVASNRSRRLGDVKTGRITGWTDSLDASAYDIALSTRLDYNLDNHIAARIAAGYIEDVAASAAARLGWYSIARTDFSMFPEERLSLSILTSPAGESGLPADMVQSDDAVAVAAAVRRAIALAAREGISRHRLEEGRKRALAMMDKATPAGVIRLVEMRYSYGKDMISRYEDRAKAVSAEDVNRILTALAGGSVAEHVLRLRDTEEKVFEPEIEAVIPDGPELPECEPSAPEKADPEGLGGLFRELFNME